MEDLTPPSAASSAAPEPAESESAGAAPHDSFEEDAAEALRQAGLRLTPPRLTVIRILARATQAMSASEIHAAANRGKRSVDPVSVYRVLATLRRLGLVVNLGSVDGYFPSRVGASEESVSTMLVNAETREVEEIDAGPLVAGPLRETIRDRGYEPGEIRIEAMVTPDEGTVIHIHPLDGKS